MKRLSIILVILLLQCDLVWAEDWPNVTDPFKVFEAGYIQVVGKSASGQKEYGATRSAKTLAERDILEVLEGITIYGQTKVRDAMLASDEIQATVKGFLRGAVECGSEFFSSQGYAKVCMRLYLRGKDGLYDKVLPTIEENGVKPASMPVFDPSPRLIHQAASGSTPVVVDDSGVPVAKTRSYDGIIVDVKDYQFKPAVVNRILTDKQEVVFEPARVISQVLIERGCGGFTTDMKKARALLESWGSKSPMMVKSKQVINLTDVEVSPEDAAVIYVQDEKNNILAQARVVFVLK